MMDNNVDHDNLKSPTGTESQGTETYRSSDALPGMPDGGSSSTHHAPQPASFLARQGLSLFLIATTVAMVALSLALKSTDWSTGDESAQTETASSAARRGIHARLEQLEKLAKEYQETMRTDPESMTRTIAARPRVFVSLIVFGLFSLAILGVAAAGLVLCIWFLLRMRKGRPVMAQAESIEPKWSVLDALAAIATLFLAVIVLSIVMRRGDFQPLFAGLMGYALAVAFGRYVVRERCRQPLAAAGANLSAFWRNVGRGTLGYMAALPVFGAVALLNMLIMQRLLGAEPGPGQSPLVALLDSDSPALLAGYIVLIVLIGPIAEEFLFRGLLQGALRRRLSAKWTIVLTAAIFAGIHRSPVVIPPIFVLGLFLAYLYEKTRSLVATSTLHVLQNSIAVTVILLLRFVTAP